MSHNEQNSLACCSRDSRGGTQAVLGFGVNQLHRMWRLAAYLWPMPYTVMGIAIGLILAGRFRVVDGVIEIHGPGVAGVLTRLPVPAMALTLGHVVFGQTRAALDITRNHERVHVRQYERWGIVFLPAYLGASAVLYLRGRDGYRENPFEIEAYAVDEHGDV